MNFTQKKGLGPFTSMNLRIGGSLAGYLLLSPTLLMLISMMVAPMCALIVLSFASQSGQEIEIGFTFRNYLAALDYRKSPQYLDLIARSLRVSLIATAVVIAAAYPMAYFLAFQVQRRKLIWLILLILPSLANYLLRVFSWKLILGYNGLVNSALTMSGVSEAPIAVLLYSQIAVTITLAHSWVAFAVLPIYVSLEKIDRGLLEAASDLGDSPFGRFLRVTLPLSMPGVMAAVLLVFIPTTGDYVTPTLVGGPDGMMIGNVIQVLFGRVNDAPMGAAVSLLTMVLVTAASCLLLGGLSVIRNVSRGQT